MDCGEVRDRIAPLLDGELDDEEARAAFEHLDACQGCRDLFLKADAVPFPSRPMPIRCHPARWDSLDRALDEEASRRPSLADHLLGWLGGDVALSRGMVLVYLAILGLSVAWQVRDAYRAERSGGGAEEAEALQEARREPVRPPSGASQPVSPASTGAVHRVY